MTSTENDMPEYELTDDEFKEAFFSLKANKNAGYDDISYDVVKHCFDFLEKPLKRIFKMSLTKGIFPDQLKLAEVTPICKTNLNSESLSPNISLTMFFKNIRENYVQ